MPQRNVILLVHGMGNHPQGTFVADFKRALSDRATSFGLDADSILAQVDYQEFNYNDEFDEIRKQFAENAAARSEGFGYLTGMGKAAELVQQLTAFEGKLGKDEFLYTHWLDVVLYGTMYYGEALRVRFCQQLNTLIQQYGSRRVHVVCHSLGTALVHDALAKFYRSGLTAPSAPGEPPGLPLGAFNLGSLWTFANVGRMVNLLNGLTDPLNSTVVTGNAGCTYRFFKVRNRYDPFTWFKPYDRVMDPNEGLVIESICDYNTHDFYQYVTEPHIAKALLALIYDTDVSDAQFAQGLAAYRTTDLRAQAGELVALVDQTAQDPSITGLEQALAKFKEIRTLIDSLKAAPQP